MRGTSTCDASDPTSLRVLVLHQGWPVALYLVAELARLGVRPVLAGSAEHPLLRRYAREQVHAEYKTADGRARLAQLLAASPWDAVVATTDEWLAAVLAAGVLDTRLVWPRLDPLFAPALSDRRAMDALVRELGVAVPARRDADEHNLDKALAELGTPCIVRGTAGAGGAQVRTAGTLAEARTAVNELASVSPGAPYLQAFVPGPTVLVGGLYADGRCLQSYAAEKTAVHPPPFGPSVCVRSIDAPAAVALADRIFGRLRFHGVGFVEFKLPPGREPVFIELNPRPWGSARATRAAGVDILAQAARQIVGMDPVPARVCRAGREAALFPQYLDAVIERGELKRGDLAPLLRALRAIPWREPRLALHFCRQLYWGHAAQKRRRAAAGV